MECTPGLGCTDLLKFCSPRLRELARRGDGSHEDSLLDALFSYSKKAHNEPVLNIS
jgi:hypothetical protein